jgi:hypothetical protein
MGEMGSSYNGDNSDACGPLFNPQPTLKAVVAIKQTSDYLLVQIARGTCRLQAAANSSVLDPLELVAVAGSDTRDIWDVRGAE